jgi:hypothetical protein
MNYLFIYLFRGAGGGRGTNCSLEQGDLRCQAWEIHVSKWQQDTTSSLVMFEREYYIHYCDLMPRGNSTTDLNWLDVCVYATLIVARLLRWLVPLSRWLFQPIKKHQNFILFNFITIIYLLISLFNFIIYLFSLFNLFIIFYF